MPADEIGQVLDRVIGRLHLRVHPDVQRLEQQALAWFEALDLPGLSPACRARLHSSELGTAVGALFPSADYAALLWWSKFTYWNLAFDDAYAEDNAAADLVGFFQQAGRVWLASHDTPAPEPSGSAFAAVLRDLLGELDLLVCYTVAIRVRQALRDYLFAAAWEATALLAEQRPDLETYRSFRRHVQLQLINIEFVEHLPGLTLTGPERQDSRVCAIRALASDISNHINDLCSLPLEFAAGRGVMPITGFGEHKLDQYLGELRGQCLERVEALQNLKTATAVDPKLHSYCTAVCQWVAGVAWWHERARSHRYSG
ncbi:hypothetical protein ABZ078_36945 [Streptomyces sp. NPDC006385]|uniref:terpene synthase family protein n=1 Tax=Streptomyces sp. NPDC006385 TaxID=3156761 RepID=UPI0033B52E13